MLRTAVALTGVPVPLQTVHRHVPLPVTRLDWSGLGPAEREGALRRLLDEDRARGIDLGRPRCCASP